MQLKRTSIIFALLLAVLLVVAIIPFSAVTAFAALNTEITVTNVEIGMEGKTPTAGDRIFTPEVLSVNGDATLKDLIKIDSSRS